MPKPHARPGPASKLELWAWMMFDFGNSAYTTIVVTVVYGPYFKDVVVGGSAGTFYWGLGNSIAQTLVLVSAPVVGAIADYAGAKKKFLIVSYLGCIAATCGLHWVGPGDLALGLLLFVVSNFFFSSGENIIAAFLPEISTPERMGRISGWGWALGYVGGLASLLACRPLLNETSTVPTAFLVVGAFFLVGGLPTWLFLRERGVASVSKASVGYLKVGFQRVGATLRQVRQHRQLYRFLLVFLCYNGGIIIVITFSAIFATDVDEGLGLSGEEMTTFFIVAQVSASIGAFGFGFLQDRIGSKAALMLALWLWLAVCVGGSLCQSAAQFYVVGNLAGLAMGGAQSGARALVGLFSPPGRSAEYFGFWGLVWKLSNAVAPLVFGTLALAIGMRLALLLTGGLFVVGLFGMRKIDVAEGRREATEAPRGSKN